MAPKHRPQRSCVACRQKRDKRDLTRLVYTDGGLRIDRTGKMNGRGAYLCAEPGCWEMAAARSMMAAALRRGLGEEDRQYLRRMKPA